MEDALISGRESSLHSAIKKWYLLEGDKPEAKVEDFIIDIARGNLLIEIQIANFSAIKPKLMHLPKDHKVRIVYPIAREKWIIHKSTANGEISGRRLSPRKGNLSDLFSELIRIPTLFSNNNLSVEVLMIEMEEIWCHDGRGSWRRRGASIEDRKLIRVFERKVLEIQQISSKCCPRICPSPFQTTIWQKASEYGLFNLGELLIRSEKWEQLRMWVIEESRCSSPASNSLLDANWISTSHTYSWCLTFSSMIMSLSHSGM